LRRIVASFDLGSPDSSRHLGDINIYDLAGTRDYLQGQGYLLDGVHSAGAGGQYLATILYQE